MLTDTDLDSMRNCISETSFADAVAILQPIKVSDNKGGFTTTWGTVTTTGRVGPYLYGGQESIAGANGRLEATLSWTVAVPYNVSLNVKDRVVWTGGTLEVISTDHSRTYPLEICAMCREINP
jgi:hypothetical protein